MTDADLSAEPQPGTPNDGAELSRAGKWLHPSSLLFGLAAAIRHQLIPAILALLSATTGSWIGGMLALLIFVVSMTLVVLRYFRLRYRLTDNALIVDEGIIFRVHRTVPVERIQNIDLVQNVFHRLLGVAEVRVETASGTEPEATLKVLSLADIESLRDRIFSRKQNQALAQHQIRAETDAWAESGMPAIITGASLGSYAGRDEPTIAEPPYIASLQREPLPGVSGQLRPSQVSEPVLPGRTERVNETAIRETLVKLSLQHLALAGIASNRGSALLFVGVGIIWQQASATIRAWHIDADQLTRYVSGELGWVAWLSLVVVGLVGLLALIKALSIGWYVLKFYDYTLDRAGEDLRVSCGLLTRVSATVRRDRIQFISIHRTLVGRWLKIASIRLETAGGGKENDDPASTIARRWFMPVISESQIPAVMQQLCPGLQWQEDSFDWQPLSNRATQRRRRLIVFVACCVAVVAAALQAIPFVVVALVLGAIGWWSTQKIVAAMRYARSGGRVLFRSGVLTQKTSLAFVDKIQSVAVDRSPFDRRWQMATLSIDTVAAGPAEHRIKVPMLDAAFARAERDSLCRLASAQ